MITVHMIGNDKEHETLGQIPLMIIFVALCHQTLQLYTQPPSCEVTSWIYGFIWMDIEISAVHIQDLFPNVVTNSSPGVEKQEWQTVQHIEKWKMLQTSLIGSQWLSSGPT